MMQWYMLSIGLVLTLTGVALLIKRVLFLIESEHVQGTIVEIVERHRRDRGKTLTYYHPKVHFIARDRKEYDVIGEIGTSSSSLKLGKQYGVRYDPANPEKAMLSGVASLWAAPTTLLVLGGVPLFIGLKAIIGF